MAIIGNTGYNLLFGDVKDSFFSEDKTKQGNYYREDTAKRLDFAENFYVRQGSHSCKFKTEALLRFRLFRRIINEHYNCIHRDQDVSNVGKKSSPLVLTDLEIDLAKLETICNLTD